MDGTVTPKSREPQQAWRDAAAAVGRCASAGGILQTRAPQAAMRPCLVSSYRNSDVRGTVELDYHELDRSGSWYRSKGRSVNDEVGRLTMTNPQHGFPRSSLTCLRFSTWI